MCIIFTHSPHPGAGRQAPHLRAPAIRDTLQNRIKNKPLQTEEIIADANAMSNHGREQICPFSYTFLHLLFLAIHIQYFNVKERKKERGAESVRKRICLVTADSSKKEKRPMSHLRSRGPPSATCPNSARISPSRALADLTRKNCRIIDDTTYVYNHLARE